MEFSPAMKATEFSLNELDLFQSRAGGNNRQAQDDFLAQYRNLVRSQVEIETERLANAKAELEKENQSLKTRLAELERKNNQIGGEMLILTNLLQERNAYETTIKQLREALERSQELQHHYAQISQQANALPGLASSLQSDNIMLHQQNDALRREIGMLKQLTVDLRADNEKLLIALDSVARQVQTAANVAGNAAGKVEESPISTDIRAKVTTLQHALIQNEILTLEFEAEKLAFETTIEHLRKRIGELERRNETIASQNAVWYQMLAMRERNMEIESMRRSTTEDELRNQLETMRKDNDRLMIDVYNLREEASKFVGERNLYDSQLRQMKLVNDYSKEESTRIFEMLALRRREYDDLITQWEETRTENQHLHEENNKLKHENLVMMERCELISIESAENAKAREAYKEQAERAGLDGTKKNKELVEKINSLKEVRAKYEACMAEAVGTLEKRVGLTPKQQKDQMATSTLRSPRAVISTIATPPQVVDKKK